MELRARRSASRCPIDAGITSVVKTLGHIDILVCSAGMQIVSPVEALTLADWQRVLAVRLNGAIPGDSRGAVPAVRAGARRNHLYGMVHSKRLPSSRLRCHRQARDRGAGEGRAMGCEFTMTQGVAQAALFFASIESAAVTGQSLVASHGWSMQ